MPTKHARLTFTPSPEVLRSIQRIAKASRAPTSAIVAECMDMLTEHLENMANLLDETAALSSDAKAVMAKAAESAAGELLPHYLEARRVIGDLARSVEDVTSEAQPPSSNTGATSPATARRRAA